MNQSPAQFHSLKQLCREMHPVGPSYREISDLWGIKSLGRIKKILDNMRDLAMVDWIDGRARSLHIVTQARMVYTTTDARLVPHTQRILGLRNGGGV